MKRTISVLLSIIIILIVCVAKYSAEVVTEKMDEALRFRIIEMDDNTAVTVWIWYTDEEIFFKENNIPEESIIFKSKITNSAIIITDKKQLFALAQSEPVLEIFDYSSTSTIPAPFDGKEYFCLDSFIDYLGTLPYDELRTIDTYEELYYHYAADGQIDYVLINSKCGPAEMLNSLGIIGNRVLIMGAVNPFSYGMALYDVKTNKFYDLAKMRNYVDYEGLIEAIDRYGYGRLIGDMDKDNELTIIDATIIQRCLAGITEYPEDDTIIDNSSEYFDPSFSQLEYYSDFDRNGNRDILDATATQRYLAGLITEA